MSDEFHGPDRTWRQKFKDAFRGFREGIRDQNSFYVHFLCSALLIAVSIYLRLTLLHWAVLLLCVTVVLAAEMFNTAIEHLAKAVDRSHNPHIGDSLDIGSAAVLICALGAATVGALVLIDHLVQWWVP